MASLTTGKPAENSKLPFWKSSIWKLSCWLTFTWAEYQISNKCRDSLAQVKNGDLEVRWGDDKSFFLIFAGPASYLHSIIYLGHFPEQLLIIFLSAKRALLPNHSTCAINVPDWVDPIAVLFSNQPLHFNQTDARIETDLRLLGCVMKW